MTTTFNNNIVPHAGIITIGLMFLRVACNKVVQQCLHNMILNNLYNLQPTLHCICVKATIINV